MPGPFWAPLGLHFRCFGHHLDRILARVCCFKRFYRGLGSILACLFGRFVYLLVCLFAESIFIWRFVFSSVADRLVAFDLACFLAGLLAGLISILSSFFSWRAS